MTGPRPVRRFLAALTIGCSDSRNGGTPMADHIEPTRPVFGTPGAEPDAWKLWLRVVEDAMADPGADFNPRAALAEALAGADYPALAAAIAPARTLLDAAARDFDTYGVAGVTVRDVRSQRPDLTRDEARTFLVRHDDRMAAALGGHAEDVLRDHLEADDEIPEEPDDIDDLREAWVGTDIVAGVSCPHCGGRVALDATTGDYHYCVDCGRCEMANEPPWVAA